MVCPNGHTSEWGAKFCSTCGEAIQQSDEPHRSMAVPVLVSLVILLAAAAGFFYWKSTWHHTDDTAPVSSTQDTTGGDSNPSPSPSTITFRVLVDGTVPALSNLPDSFLQLAANNCAQAAANRYNAGEGPSHNGTFTYQNDAVYLELNPVKFTSWAYQITVPLLVSHADGTSGTTDFVCDLTEDGAATAMSAKAPY